NIYHGMDAQILLNCTFSRWRFSAGDNHPDGGVQEQSDRDKITQRMVAYARRQDWPAPDPVIEAYFHAGAYGWFRVEGADGAEDNVCLSSDVGPYGERAQRVEVLRTAPGDQAGIGQWTYLPLHRIRSFQFRIVVRAVAPCTLKLCLRAVGASSAVTSTEIVPDGDWQTFTGSLALPDDAPAEALYQFSLTAAVPAHFVLDRVQLYPEDHIGGADPDVIRMLKDSHLPLLRWPGGNFVSGYHWRDGVGPVDARPTRPNPAWEGLEFNLFGTDEFIAFCREVGCEPMVCVNAGNGTPEEAAAWVEYCNGGPETPMGRLRAENGHPAPYDVRYWEIGNEIYGRWQVGWTTPAGNVDRYQRFRESLWATDPSLQLLGCGYGNEPDSEWNRTLIDSAGKTLRCITDHILTGGSVDAGTDAIELYHAFMGYPTELEERYRALETRMRQAGIVEPRLAITELQLFAHFQGETGPDGSLTPTMVPRPDTIAEALSLTAIVNTCIRLGDFVELLTHSATVNHGGGLRKERERVYANPVHYAHALGHAVAGGTPVAVRLACATFSTPHAFAHIPPLHEVPVIDAMAVISETGNLVLTLVHRGGDCGPLELTIDLDGFRAQKRAELVTLAGETWFDRNTREAPDKITPRRTQITLGAETQLVLTLPPFSITQIMLKEAMDTR
ncbi:MAG: alpha-N-arabinofuranosidase, partial [Anaerolineae bacterium]|nr:alpha-N-arabinofuranosidase [Anaerolineae bacterium]